MTKLTNIQASLLAGACSLAFGSAAFAQQAPAPASEEADAESIVVTGSRVIINGDDSPTPLTAVTADQLLTAQPTTIVDAVNNLPVFSAPRTQVSNPNTGIGAGGGGNAVANQLNLRNLLPQRTLILFDGRRVAPTTSTGIVDVDTIPQFLLQKVEVATGGVSAVYGSDAVAGVVNFITDRKFNGIKGSAQYGISDRSDDKEFSAGFGYGTKIGDRGHFMASYEYRDNKGIDRRSSRPEFWQWSVQGNGSAAAPFFLTGDAKRTDLSFGGVVRSGLLNGQEFKTLGTLANRTLGIATSAPTIRIGGDGVTFDGSLKASQRSHQLYARFDYDLSDDVLVYVQGAGNFKRNGFFGQGLTYQNVTINRNNAFLPQGIRDTLAAAGQTTFTFGKLNNDIRIRPVIDESQFFLNTTFEGKTGSGWDWNLGYVYSSSKLANTEFNNLNNLKLAAALDSSVVNGQAVCNVSITNPGLYPGCTPINVFGPGSETAAQLAYILDTTHFTAYTKQHDISGAITGSPFATGAGEVRVALSGEYRHQTYRSTSDAETVAVGTAGCVGLIAANCVASTTQGWFQTFPNRTPISQSVTEAAVEVNVPVLANSAIGDSFDLSGAARWTHYNTTGTYWTWKVGLDWKVSSDIRFRGTVSRDIRAPTLDDLFAATSCFPANTTDLLTGLNSTATDCTVANPNLTSEIGKTLTAGVVLKPGFIPGLSMSFDYYNITIDNAITTVVGTNQTIQAACYSSNGTSPYCALQDRALGSFTNTAAANFVTNWRRTVFNIAKIKTAGFDFETNYRTKLMGHPFALRALVTYQPHVRFFQPGIPVVLDMGGIAYGQNGTQASPKWRITAFLNFEPVDNLTINLMHRWRSSLGITADPSQFTTGPSTPGYGTTNINLGYKIPVSTGSAEVFFSIQNMFDNIGPPANFGGGQANIGLFGGFPIGDDPVGRRFTAGVKFKF